MNKNTTILLVIAVLIIGGIVLSKRSVEQLPTPIGTNDTAQPSTTPPTTPPPATPIKDDTPVTVSTTVSVPSSSTTKTFTIQGGNFAFDPKTMSVKKGDTVKITFVNVEGFHDLRVDGYNVATAKLAAGTSETITFVANKAGTFEYYCTVGSHRAMGMSGMLTVTP